MVLFPQARVRAGKTFRKEVLDFLVEVLSRGSTEDGRPAYSQEATDSIESEEFDNINQECSSPPAKSPDVRPAKVEGSELQLEHSTKGQHGLRSGSHAMLLVCATVHASTIWHFGACAMTSGSSAFLLIYLLLLGIVGISFGALELTLGQYTSLPVCVLFGRIAPIATGVSVLLLLVRLLSSLFLYIQPRYLIFFYNFMLVTLTSDRTWLDCKSYPGTPCLPEVCDPGYVWMNDKCDLENGTAFTSLPMSVISDIYTRSESSVTFSPSHIFLLELSQSSDVALLLADLTLLAFAGFIVYKGNKVFGKIAPILVACTVFGLALLSCYCLFVVIHQRKFSLVLQALRPQWTKLGDLATWLNAALQVLFTVGLGDGTLITLGSQADFKNDIIKEVTIMTAVGAGIRILGTIAAVLLAVASKQASSISFDVLLNLSREGESFWYRLPFTLLPEIEPDSMLHRLTDTFYLGMVISVLGFQVVTIEMFLAAFYRGFPQLMHLPSQMSRHLLVCLIVSAMGLIIGVSYQYNASLSDDYFNKVYHLEIFTVLVFFQLAATLGMYGPRRIIVNLETMIGQYYSTRRLAWGGKLAFIVWIYVLPIFVVAGIVVSTLYKKYFSLGASSAIVSLMAAIPLIVAAHLITKSLGEGQPVYRIFQTHPKWGPLNIQNRRKATRDEMAARVFNY